ncbi:MAG: carboxypeptidase regulatory-like domain-containing protein [Gemmatimonadetes bacterium]|nr:carboxypeptidase regulatory-like domain-containing protein [Gemmatimonadota bacterium]
MRPAPFPSAILLGAFGLLMLAAPIAHAQSAPDVVRGRVTDDSAHVVIGATVMITRGPDRLTQQAVTDSTGAYRSRFEEGTGDYLVYVAVAGFKPVRRRVQRQGDERELVADLTLARDLTVLAALKVTAVKPERASNQVRPSDPEPGSGDMWKQGVEGQVSPSVAGDLTAVAGTMPNVTMTPAGASILGSGSESNLTTLNGMGLASGSIPRAARTETRVTGATFDATRGGFAGANIDVRLGPGDRFYQRRNAFVTFDPPSLQITDPVSRALGTTSGGFRGSVGADGELIRRALTYNVALDVSRAASSPSTLVSADADALLRAGVAPDSVARLIAIATPLGIPLAGRDVPSDRERSAITWLGRLDDTRDTLQTRALTTIVGVTRDGAIGFGPLAAPAAAGERRERTLGSQLTFGAFVGPGHRVLTESRLAASAVHTEVAPYRALPSANVLVRSALSGMANDITNLVLGGSTLVTTDDRWTVEGSNETGWNANGRRHRFKAMAWGRLDGLRQQGATNALGNYTFNSLEDFAENRPSSYSRTLSQPDRSAAVWNVATAFSHTWAPSRFLGVIYGARLEGDGFTSPPPRNAALESALGVRSGVAPSRVHVSPRVGFSYTYNRDRENGNGTSSSPVGRFYRTQTGTIRGGIGEFRDLLRPGLLADATASSGLPGGTLTLSCVGAAVPQPDWSNFDAGASPTQCLDGSGVLAERAPSVILIDPSYDVPRSWRSSLDWSGNVRSLLVRVGGMVSYDLDQPGVVDANFSGVQKLALALDGSRPLYVSPASIDPTTGAVSAAESRRSAEFGRVVSRVSDLRGYGGQLTIGLSPDVFRYRPRHSLFVSANYTLQSSRRQYRGFDGAGFGDPRVVEWAPSQSDARHIVVLTGGTRGDKIGVLTLFARAQSGLPFTPVVQGDVNGDGRTYDRAFIPNPAVESDLALAASVRSLMDGGSPSARRCLQAYLGKVAERNGCRGPWTQSLNVQWRPPMPQRWGGRVAPTLYLQNVLAGVDQLVHGTSRLQGWGSPASPDPVLFVPRAFDAAANRFRYDVNPRFADTRPNRNLYREPFRIVVDFSLQLSTDFSLQQLRRAVEPVKTTEGWQRRSADSIAAFYLQNSSSIHKALLAETDSLFLSRAQVAALQKADSLFSDRVRQVYFELGEYLARGNGSAGRAEMDSASTAQKTYWRIFWEQPEIADSIVTPAQRALFPMLGRMVETPKKESEHSQWKFGHSVQMRRPAAAATKPNAPPSGTPGATEVRSTGKP